MFGAGDGSLPFPFGNPRHGGDSLARTAVPPHSSPQTKSTPTQDAVCLCLVPEKDDCFFAIKLANNMLYPFRKLFC